MGRPYWTFEPYSPPWSPFAESTTLLEQTHLRLQISFFHLENHLGFKMNVLQAAKIIFLHTTPMELEFLVECVAQAGLASSIAGGSKIHKKVHHEIGGPDLSSEHSFDTNDNCLPSVLTSPPPPNTSKHSTASLMAGTCFVLILCVSYIVLYSEDYFSDTVDI